VVDEVALIHEGKLQMRASLEQLKRDFKKIRAVYPDVVPDTFPIDSLVRTELEAHQALLTVSSYDPAMEASLREAGAESTEVLDLSLEEIFVETVKGGRQ